MTLAVKMTLKLPTAPAKIGALLLAVAFCVAGSAQSRPEQGISQHSPAKRTAVAGVKNFGEVTPFLYRGAQPSPEGFKTLARMGVDIVVDARLSGHARESRQVTALGMQYVSVPWHCLFPKDKAIAKFLAVVRENPGKKIFVHCRYGDDRTGMMIAAYRMADQQWSPQEAATEMRQFGFNRNLCFPLQTYERTFPQHLKKYSQLQASVTAAK